MNLVFCDYCQSFLFNDTVYYARIQKKSTFKAENELKSWKCRKKGLYLHSHTLSQIYYVQKICLFRYIRKSTESFDYIAHNLNIRLQRIFFDEDLESC